MFPSKLKLALGLSFCLICGPMEAWKETANSTLKGVQSDLSRALTEAEKLEPTRKPNIKRLLNSLSLAEGRLKDIQEHDEAWTEANEAVLKLKSQLEAMLTGQAAPAAPKTGAPADPAPKTVDSATFKENYGHRSAFERASRDVLGVANQLKTFQARTEVTEKPKPGLGLLQNLERAEKTLKEAGFPENYPSVVELLNQAAALRPLLEKEEKRQLDLFEQGDRVSNLKNYPAFPEDLAFLEALGKKYNERGLFTPGNEELTRTLQDSFPGDITRYREIKAKYAGFLAQNSAAYQPFHKQASDLSRNLRYGGEKIEAFEKQQSGYVGNAAEEIGKALNQAKTLLTSAVSEKKPAFFQGGIAQQMATAESKLRVYASLKGEADPEVKALRERYEAMASEIIQARSALGESILSAEAMPEDTYAGAEKSRWIDLAVSEWTKTHPDKAILARGISMPDWVRTTEWRERTTDYTKYKVDFSRLQVWLICQKDERIATRYIVELTRHHLEGDRVEVYAPKDLSSSQVFKTDLLLEKVKKN